MAVFTSSAMSLRRQLILRGLEESGAVSPETAKTLREAGVENPGSSPEYTEQLADLGIIRKTPDGKYWIADKRRSRDEDEGL